MKDGKSLGDYLNEEEFARMNTYFKKKTGVGIENMQQLKPMALISLLMNSMFSCHPKSYEDFFAEMAGKCNKEIEGLESGDIQMGVFDSIPLDIQLSVVLNIIDHEEIASKELNELIAKYKNKDIEALSELMDTSYFNFQGYEDLMLDERNINWIPIIEKAVNEGTVFIAFGAGHLAGDQGVLNLLKERGFKVTPVF